MNPLSSFDPDPVETAALMTTPSAFGGMERAWAKLMNTTITGAMGRTLMKSPTPDLDFRHFPLAVEHTARLREPYHHERYREIVSPHGEMERVIAEILAQRDGPRIHGIQGTFLIDSWDRSGREILDFSLNRVLEDFTYYQPLPLRNLWFAEGSEQARTEFLADVPKFYPPLARVKALCEQMKHSVWCTVSHFTAPHWQQEPVFDGILLWGLAGDYLPCEENAVFGLNITLPRNPHKRDTFAPKTHHPQPKQRLSVGKNRSLKRKRH